MTRDLAFDLLDELINHRKCKNWQLVGHKHCNFNELTLNLNCSPTALRKTANQLINEKRIVVKSNTVKVRPGFTTVKAG